MPIAPDLWRRRNGFQKPLHRFQVISWVVFGCDVLCYVTFVLASLDTLVAKVIVSTCYVLSVASVVIAAYRATLCDPSDPHLLNTKFNDGSTLFCSMCNSTVCDKTKHCYTCFKCVSGFDHHCMWLNNCVGKANYREFVVATTSVASMMAIVLSSCAWLIYDYATNIDDFEYRVDDAFSGLPKDVALAIVITLCIVNFPLFFLDFQLICLHIFLWTQGLTTYEYIQNKKAADSDVASAVKQKIKTLPRCMDWIIFCRCGQKRRRGRSPRPLDVQSQETTAQITVDPPVDCLSKPVKESAEDDASCRGSAIVGKMRKDATSIGCAPADGSTSDVALDAPDAGDATHVTICMDTKPSVISFRGGLDPTSPVDSSDVSVTPCHNPEPSQSLAADLSLEPAGEARRGSKEVRLSKHGESKSHKRHSGSKSRRRLAPRTSEISHSLCDFTLDDGQNAADPEKDGPQLAD